jgi:predicted enzyme related to lactoylglutathione lyase
MLGMEIEGTIEKAVASLGKKGVQFKDSVVKSEAGNFVHLEDPDGNEIYLWEVNPVTVPETDLALSEKQ